MVVIFSLDFFFGWVASHMDTYEEEDEEEKGRCMFKSAE